MDRAPDDLTVRSLRRDEMEMALDWAAREGWNPGLGDAEPFHRADPDGFLVGHVGDTPVALVSAVRHGADHGFVGFYIVAPEWRRRGYGKAIWQRAMRRLEGRAVALDGVPAEQENYRRSGFRLVWRNVRHEGRAVAGDPQIPTGTTLADLRALPWERVAAYDRPFFPTERDAFLQAWIDPPGGHALGLTRDGALAASGVIRPCRTGYKIGPCFADTPALAEALFQALQSCVPAGAPLFLDVPEPNGDALALARRHGMTPCFETARMVTGPTPDLALHRTYGITTFELG